MNGCFVLCPDFPVFRMQISTPVQIGTTFRVLDEIPLVLARMMDQLREAPVDSQTWREYHRIESIAAMMRTFLARRAGVPSLAPSQPQPAEMR